MNILILTGAGISAESGVPTFRDADGLWEGHRFEDVATPDAFERNPRLVHDFYNQRRRGLLDAQVQPNAAHRALAALEARHRGEFLLVTQNVDDLHSRAGSKKLLAMHGELLKARCVRTGEIFPWREDLDQSTANPNHPELVGTLRPHVVWFGEMPLGLEQIEAAARRADLFIAIGTSAVVYPAAGIVRQTGPRCRKVEINLDATPNSSEFDESIRGKASIEVPAFLDSLG